MRSISYCAPRFGGNNKRAIVSGNQGDSVGDRRAGGCAASRGMRITCVAFGIRNHPRERIADAMVLIVRRCQASGPSKSPKIYRYRTDYRFAVLPRSRDPSSSRVVRARLPYRTVKEYRKVLLQIIVEQPLSAERGHSLG
ncbi:hypothetical protein GEV33_005571 [Tenebrio molitor]|uniref:Uncharacterized protein n=1 Tax=Tenebrio molitor TaxID=7067 RepID=A0A8J6LDT4_TENMO|nr:hypothetical protein GEV33_005571 [Tenebrio molitor]